MESVVWKFEVANFGISLDNNAMLSPSAKIVAFGYQEHPMTKADGLFFWAVVKPDALMKKRRFVVVGTGTRWETKDLCHIMTCQDPSGYVWHLLEWRTP